MWLWGVGLEHTFYKLEVACLKRACFLGRELWINTRADFCIFIAFWITKGQNSPARLNFFVSAHDGLDEGRNFVFCIVKHALDGSKHPQMRVWACNAFSEWKLFNSCWLISLIFSLGVNLKKNRQRSKSVVVSYINLWGGFQVPSCIPAVLMWEQMKSWEKDLNTDSSNSNSFHVVFQVCCFIVPSFSGFCRSLNCQTETGRLTADANGNQMFSCINLLQTLKGKQSDIAMSIYVLQFGVLRIYPNNVWQTIPLHFFQVAREDLTMWVYLWCQSVHKRRLFMNDYSLDNENLLQRGRMEALFRPLH